MPSRIQVSAFRRINISTVVNRVFFFEIICFKPNEVAAVLWHHQHCYTAVQWAVHKIKFIFQMNSANSISNKNSFIFWHAMYLPSCLPSLRGLFGELAMCQQYFRCSITHYPRVSYDTIIERLGDENYNEIPTRVCVAKDHHYESSERRKWQLTEKNCDQLN